MRSDVHVAFAGAAQLHLLTDGVVVLLGTVVGREDRKMWWIVLPQADGQDQGRGSTCRSSESRALQAIVNC